VDRYKWPCVLSISQPALGSLLKERGIIFGLLETGCKYHLPRRYNEWIEIVTYIDDISDEVVLLRHDISRLSDRTLMVKGLEKRICLDVSDPSEFKAIDIPHDIRIILSKGQSISDPYLTTIDWHHRKLHVHYLKNGKDFDWHIWFFL
jgi:acyl-CoA thioesterase FadM